MTPETTALAQFLGTLLVAGGMYYAAQRKAKTDTKASEQSSKDYADELIGVQSARVTDLQKDIERLNERINALRAQLLEKQTELERVTRERDLAVENQALLQKELKDNQVALQQTLQRADEMEKRLLSLEQQRIGDDAVRKFADAVIALIKTPPTGETETST